MRGAVVFGGVVVVVGDESDLSVVRRDDGAIGVHADGGVENRAAVLVAVIGQVGSPAREADSKWRS